MSPWIPLIVLAVASTAIGLMLWVAWVTLD
jgi:hypothetical protein